MEVPSEHIPDDHPGDDNDLVIEHRDGSVFGNRAPDNDLLYCGIVPDPVVRVHTPVGTHDNDYILDHKQPQEEYHIRRRHPVLLERHRVA
jgi:hypothetical protein